MGFQLPTIGTWYRDQEQGLCFEIVAVDDQQGTIDVQYTDGSIDEFDLDSWPQLRLIQVVAPEDPDTVYELDREDRWDDQLLSTADYTLNPLAYIEPDSFPEIDDF